MSTKKEFSRRKFLLGGLALSLPIKPVFSNEDSEVVNVGAGKFILPIPYATAIPKLLYGYMGKYLEDKWYQENKFGGSGLIATKYFVQQKSPALMVASTTITTTNFLLGAGDPDLADSQFKPVGLFCQSPFVLAVNKNKSTTLSSLKRFLSFTKDNPGKLTYSTTGINSFPHLTVMLMEKYLGGRSLHVPYSSTGHMLPLLSGEVDFSVISLSSAIPYVESDQIKILGITSQFRHHLYKNIPTFSEFNSRCVSVVNFGLLANKFATDKLISQCQTALNKTLKDPEFLSLNHGSADFIPLKTGSQHYKKIISEERAIWSRLIGNDLRQS